MDDFRPKFVPSIGEIMRSTVGFKLQPCIPLAQIAQKPKTICPILIYLDACHRNNAGGWGSVLVYGKHVKCNSGALNEATTNAKMELEALVQALKAIKTPSTVIIHTQCQYIYNAGALWMKQWSKGGWKNKSENKYQWQQISDLVSLHTVIWKWAPEDAITSHGKTAHRIANTALDNLYKEPIADSDSSPIAQR